MSALTDRFDAIMGRIEAALAVSGRKKGDARLIAVSKFHPAQAVAELATHWGKSDLSCGMDMPVCRIATPGCDDASSAAMPSSGEGSVKHYGPAFGESYMQEARDKMPQVAELLESAGVSFCPEWHFIGHLQSKKAKDVAGKYDLIHSVDSLKLAQAVSKAWQDRVAGAPISLDATPPEPQAVLLQVNVGREAQKSGAAPDALEPLLQSMIELPGIRVKGLMCIPPLAEIGKDSRPYFVMLRELRDGLQKRLGAPLEHLSMGMSDDFEAAIEEGATLVRIGTDIFGPRA